MLFWPKEGQEQGQEVALWICCCSTRKKERVISNFIFILLFVFCLLFEFFVFNQKKIENEHGILWAAIAHSFSKIERTNSVVDFVFQKK